MLQRCLVQPNWRALVVPAFAGSLPEPPKGGTTNGAALATPVVRHVFGQPFVPGRFNLAYRLHLAVVARVGFNESNDPQIRADDVRIGTVVVAYDDRPVRLQRG